jgi:glycosyltransferase involved in cell wall biosynthesis
LSIAPGSRVSAVANGVDAASFQPPGPPGDAPAIVFTGVFDYGPNETAALWLMSDVWPRVVAARPDARLALVGASPSRAVRRKATSSAAVTVTGAVPDVRPYLWTAAVAVAPIFMSHGVQNKVLEAVAAGLPVVTTTPVLEGLPSEAIPACSVADTGEVFAREILRLLHLAPEQRRALAARADLRAVDWDTTLSGLQAIVTAAADGANRG